MSSLQFKSAGITLELCYNLAGILIAPSSRITVPFNMPFSIESLTVLANSCGCPALFGNSIAFSRLCFTFGDNNFVMLESNKVRPPR